MTKKKIIFAALVASFVLTATFTFTSCNKEESIPSVPMEGIVDDTKDVNPYVYVICPVCNAMGSTDADEVARASNAYDMTPAYSTRQVPYGEIHYHTFRAGECFFGPHCQYYNYNHRHYINQTDVPLVHTGGGTYGIPD